MVKHYRRDRPIFNVDLRSLPNEIGVNLQMQMKMGDLLLKSSENRLNLCTVKFIFTD